MVGVAVPYFYVLQMILWRREKIVKRNIKQKTDNAGKVNKAGGEKKIPVSLKRFRILMIILILFIIGVCILMNVRKKQAVTAAMKQQIQTETATIQKQDLTTNITTTGTIQSTESRTITTALTKTELSEVNVEVGDTVSVGQIVAVFSEDDINTEIERVQEKISVSEQTDAINAQATDREYLYTYGTEAISLTEAQTAVDEALEDLYNACDGYGDAKRNLQTAKDEGKDEATISQLESAVSSAYNTEKNAQEAYDKALLAQTNAIRSASNTLASTDENYQKSTLTKGDSTDELKQELEDLRTQLENCVVKAPIGGIVTSLSVKTGDTYAEGEMMTIQNCDSYTVSAQIDEYDISELELGMRVVIKTDATRDDELEGVISFISPTATTSNGSSTSATYEVTIDIITKDDRLKLGMTAKLNIIVDEAKGVFTVPYDAISTNTDGDSVIYVLDDIATQREVVVEIGMEGDYYTQIISNEIKEGMQVVIPSAAGTSSQAGSEDMAGFGFGGMGGGTPGGSGPSGGGPGGGMMP